MSNKNIVGIAAIVIALIVAWKFIVAPLLRWAIFAGIAYVVYVLFFAGRSTGSKP
jgi:hypothetical protein